MPLVSKAAFQSKCQEVLDQVREEHPNTEEFSKQLRRGGAWNINGIQQFLIVQLSDKLVECVQSNPDLDDFQRNHLLQIVQDDADKLDDDQLHALPHSNKVEFFKKQLTIAFSDLAAERKEHHDEIQELKQQNESTQAMLQRSVQAQQEELEKLKKELEEAKEFQLKYQRMKRKRNMKKGELEVEQNANKKLRQELSENN